MKKTVIALLAVLFIFTFAGCRDDGAGGKKKANAITPQQGRASGIIEEFGSKIQYEYTITFWNVGEKGGSNFGKATLTIKNVKKDDNFMKNAKYINGTFEGIFSGGPDGEIRFGDDLKAAINTQLAVFEKGANIQISGVGKIPVENPEIFSGWK